MKSAKDLREIADEIENFEVQLTEADEAGYNRRINEWAWTEYMLGIISGPVIAFVIFLIGFGIWNFIHSAAKQDSITNYCTQDSSGQLICHN